ncbi:conserved hypothetical protein [Gloeothece citriformis PCC 7424]|uniref:Uncharacterized protein n=1 Tax=Gloeothece citriformis (strain PCC 7424) TaxID=65393 RepID=B7KCI4_GLOC7|nr:hypothetical protein [Gloeothece citriformis]ACK70289.1 conserved hypothetical protein [Gloeothece citriformis PCC 7424]
MANLKDMTLSELKKYLSDHRNDDEAFSEAMGELLSRNRNSKIYPANMSSEEVGRVIQEKIQQIQQKD